ncbi:MAG: DUF4097 family beta strand repeat-containing protein [Candidatus Polarisedimenticolia bacterium]
MRKIRHILPLLALVVSVSPVAAEVTRTLRQEMTPTGAFGVENLAGTMRITQGSGSGVVVVATVHAQDDNVAGKIKLEQVRGTEGVPTLRLIYPIEEYGTFRYPGKSDDSFWSRMFGGSHNTRTTYAGEKVRVSSGDGVLLYADVEVQVPKGAEGRFRNAVGPVAASSLEGKLKFDTGSGNMDLKAIRGEVDADTGSGDIEAASMEGMFRADTGSGNVTVSAFRGEMLDCETGSGNIRLESFASDKVKAGTGSGNIKVINGDLSDFDGSTGSGNIELEAASSRLETVQASTGSGNVTLRLGDDASFEAKTETGSGNIISRYDDADPIMDRKEIVGYRRGSLKSHIKVSTGSGNIVIAPGA